LIHRQFEMWVTSVALSGTLQEVLVGAVTIAVLDSVQSLR